MPRVNRGNRVPQAIPGYPRIHQFSFLGQAAGAPAAYARDFMRVPTGGIQILSAQIWSNATLAAAAANYTTFALQTVGGTAIATRDHNSAGDGVITADTDYAMTLTAAASDQVAGVLLEVLVTPNAGGSPDLSAVSVNVAIEYVPMSGAL